MSSSCFQALPEAESTPACLLCHCLNDLGRELSKHLGHPVHRAEMIQPLAAFIGGDF
jgi:hypothetical protein